MDEAGMNLTGRMMADMDPRLLEFLQTTIDSFIKWDLICFFHDNPHTTDTAENLARYAGRSADAIRADLVELAEAGVLEETQVGELTVYSMNEDPETKELMDSFVEASGDRQFRVKAIYHIIRSTLD